MASIYDLKSKFQNVLRPTVIKLAEFGITANQVTIFALLLSCFMGGIIFFNPNNLEVLLFVPVVLFIRMALNAIDGMLAREHDMQSSLGAILNELSDVLSDTVIYLPFALLAGIQEIWVVLIVIMAVIVEMTGVIAVQIGANRRYDGPMGKSDRAFIFGAIALFLGLEIISAKWVNYILIIVFILLCLTVLNRTRAALQQLEK